MNGLLVNLLDGIMLLLAVLGAAVGGWIIAGAVTGFSKVTLRTKLIAWGSTALMVIPIIVWIIVG